MKILFLDIDGVLNSEAYAKKFHELHLQELGQHIFVDPDAVELVRELCETDHVKIILSSSWRSYDLKSTLEDLDRYRDLRPILKFIIGVTTSTMSRHRGEEIRRTLDDWEILVDRGLIDPDYRDKGDFQYAIIDDDCDILPTQKGHFVQTDWTVGITEEDVKWIKEVLR